MARPTMEAAREFCRDLNGTIEAKRLNPEHYRSVYRIAEIMGTTVQTAIEFCSVAVAHGFMDADPYQLPSWVTFQTLYRVSLGIH